MSESSAPDAPDAPGAPGAPGTPSPPGGAGHYVHGYSPTVLNVHAQRTVGNSATYLRPYLTPGAAVLDVGCGPGSITVDMARLVAPGRVSALDTSEEVLRAARQAGAAAGVDVEWLAADGNHLPFADRTFDVVHAHQLLQHVADPVAMIGEMRRVTRPGGVIGVRDADYGGMTWYPPSGELTEWSQLYHEVTGTLGVQADAGRRLLAWFLAAGFDAASLEPSASVWLFATAEQRRWWGDSWAARTVESSLGEQARAFELADADTLERIAAGWRRWAQEPDGWFLVPHGEVVAHV